MVRKSLCYNPCGRFLSRVWELLWNREGWWVCRRWRGGKEQWPASLPHLELLKAVCTGHSSWPLTPLRPLAVKPANSNKKKKKTKRKQANWPTNQTAPQLSTLLWISTITGLHVLIHLPLGLLHYSHTLCFLTLQSSVHLGLFLPVLPDFRPCYSVLCILHLFLPIMCSLSWIMVLLFFMDEQLISCCLAIRTLYSTLIPSMEVDGGKTHEESSAAASGSPHVKTSHYQSISEELQQGRPWREPSTCWMLEGTLKASTHTRNISQLLFVSFCINNTGALTTEIFPFGGGRYQKHSRTFTWELESKAKPSQVQSLSHVLLFATPWTAAHHASLSITNSRSSLKPRPLSRWCHPTISSSVVPFSSCPQSFPASGSFQTSQLFARGGQSIGVSASTSVLPMNTQDWSPLGWTSWISLQSKGL